MGTKAISYLRVSGKGQIDGDGFPRQRTAVEQYARQNGLEILAEYRDEGVSGKNELDDRPGLIDALAHIEANGVRVVLIENSSRWARALITSELLLAEFRKAGAQVIDCSTGRDIVAASAGDTEDDFTANLIRQVLAAFDEYDRKKTVARLRRSRTVKRLKTGRCEGVKPFGTLPGEAETVERMRQLHRKPRGGQRPSYARIAEQLNTEGRPTRTGAPWVPETVRRILGRK